MTIYIFEGPDGVGKTTAAQRLADELDAPMIHHGPPPPGVSWIEEYLLPVVKLLAEGHSDIIIDRGFMAEPMWAGIYDREPMMNVTQWRNACEVFAGLGAACFIILRDPAEIYDVLVMRGEVEQQSLERIETITAGYLELHNLLQLTGFPTVLTMSDDLHSAPHIGSELVRQMRQVTA
jgi:DNA polymerase III delta prime subunit